MVDGDVGWGTETTLGGGEGGITDSLEARKLTEKNDKKNKTGATVGADWFGGCVQARK